MADQKKWLKFWETALTDPDLENLELENFGRYAKLLLFICAHGNKGKIRFPEPFRALKNLFRLDDIEAIKNVTKLFPNCHYDVISGPKKSDGKNIVTLEIEFSNWHKYQVDSSKERMRRFRAKSDGVRGEERRREVTASSFSASPEADEGVWHPPKPEGEMEGPYG